MCQRLVSSALAVLLLCAAGCKDKPAVEAPAAEKPKAAAASVTAPSDEFKVEKEVYSYDPRGRRDPFLSIIVDIKTQPPRKKKSNPVENFDVDEIKLIAVVMEKDRSYAMITLPDGKSYTIRKGMTLGLYGGRVEEITARTVRITEQVKNYKGQNVIKDTVLKLREEGE
ncbi:MAG: pilus assembly protein PilP [Nitrospirae bacterium]|nr:pilus assembly protein PilP [Nitrospirota bacterium]